MGRRKRRAFTREYKAEVVRLVRTSGKSIPQLAKELDLGETGIRAWVKQAEIDEKRDPHGPMTTDEKAEVVRLVRTSGKGIPQLAKELELGESGVRAWVKQAEIDEKRDPHGPMTTDEKAEVARLRRELKTVTMERDFLRKAAAFFARSGK